MNQIRRLACRFGRRSRHQVHRHWATATGPLGHWATGPRSHRATGSLGHWATGPLNLWATGQLGHWTTEPCPLEPTCMVLAFPSVFERQRAYATLRAPSHHRAMAPRQHRTIAPPHHLTNEPTNQTNQRTRRTNESPSWGRRHEAEPSKFNKFCQYGLSHLSPPHTPPTTFSF